MNRHRRSIWRLGGSVGVAVMLAVAAAGCGGSSSSDSSDAPNGSDTTFKASKQQKLAKQLPVDVAKSKTLTVGVALASPPDEFQDEDNNIVGWEPDLMRAVAKTLGLKLVFKPTGFDSLIPGLQASRYDAAIGEFGVTNKRMEVVDFVSTILGNELFAVRKESSIKVDGLADLCGLTVATDRGSVEADLAKGQNPKCKAAGKKPIDLNVYNSADQSGHALMSNRVDVFWLGSTAISYFVKQTDGQTKVVGEYGEPYPWGIALPKNTGMAKSIRGAVQHLIDSGTYLKILKKWGVESGAVDKAVINPKVSG
ncbi:MAG: ABC transporter substrate-binding protein [Nocardioidaceae bacterium]